MSDVRTYGVDAKSDTWIATPMGNLSVNAIASFAATTGLSEAARRTVDALLSAGIDVAIEDFDYGAPRDERRFPTRLKRLPRGRPHDVDICFLNVNELHIAEDEYLRETGRSRKLIASWYWELPFLPSWLEHQVERVDEIWTASRFVRDVFSIHTDKPVHVVPCLVEPVADPFVTRRDFGIDERTCVCLFSFDANSTLARKNPRAVIESFRAAIPKDKRGKEVTLVMKSINLNNSPEARYFLEHELALVGGIMIDDDLTSLEMGALLSISDIYISMHRAEGFGLGLAEAMYFGKAAVGTAYSGNLDFMTPTNSCLVGYDLVPVNEGDLRFNPGSAQVYEPGQLWANPRVSDAARRVRYLVDHPQARRRMGERAAASIREQCSAVAIGGKLRGILGSK